jgi:hypothetical protein
MRVSRSLRTLLTGLFITSTIGAGQAKKPVEKSACPPEYRETLTSEQCKSVRVWVGMTIEQLHTNWGLPDKVTTTLLPSGHSSSQLTYRHRDTDDTDYVYLNEAGVVTSVRLEYPLSKRLSDLNATEIRKNALQACWVKATTQEEKVACVNGPRKEVK